METKENNTPLDSTSTLTVEKLIKLIIITFLKSGVVLKCEGKSHFGSVVKFSIVENVCHVYPFGTARISLCNEAIFLKYLTQRHDNLIYKIVNESNMDCQLIKRKNSFDIVIVSLTKKNRKLRLRPN